MRKAQAAMEFLMTYSWAILVILVTVGALTYFGVLSTDRFIPESCKMPQGWLCQVSANGDEVSMYVENGAPFNVENITIEAANPSCIGNFSGPSNLIMKEGGIYSINCSIESAKIESDLTIYWTKEDSTLVHQSPGFFLVKP